MGWDSPPEAGAYVRHLADHARRLQIEARAALERGDHTRASRLIGDAELLAEDVHDLVMAMERCEFSALATLATYDLMGEPDAAPPRPVRRLPLSSRALGIAIGASLAFSFAITEL